MLIDRSGGQGQNSTIINDQWECTEPLTIIKLTVVNIISLPTLRKPSLGGSVSGSPFWTGELVRAFSRFST